VYTNNIEIEILWCDAKRNSQGDDTLLAEVEHTRRVHVEEKKFGDDERFDVCVAPIRRKPLCKVQ